MGSNKDIDDCAICLDKMGAGDTVIVLACNDKHQYHERCYNNFMKDGDNYCPLCRALINRDAVKKTKLQAPAEMNVADAFGLGSDQKGLNKDVDIVTENDFARDAPPTDANLMIAPE